MQIHTAFAFLMVSLLPIAPARSDEEKARLGRVTWSAFECSMIAEMAGKNEEAERLFQVGLQTGREFLKALDEGKISREEMSSMVPIGITMRLGGPSHDFILGRVHSAVSGDAYDSIVKEDPSGLPLATEDWIRDEELKASRAETAYLKRNCEIIKHAPSN